MLFTVVVSLAMFEGTVRLFDLFRAPREVAAERPPAIEPSAERAAASTVVHPFLGWSRRPGVPLEDPRSMRGMFPGGRPSAWYLENNHSNAFGFRSATEDYRAVAAEDFAIGIFGGSLSNELATLGGDAIVRTLSERRPELSGKIRVLNLGLGGYKQPQQLFLLSEMIFLGVPFDVVLNFDGFNEVAFGGRDASQGHHPVFPVRALHLRTIDFSGGSPSRAEIELAAEALRRRREARELGETLHRSRLLSKLETAKAILGSRIMAAERAAINAERESELLAETRRAPGLAEVADPCLGTPFACLELIADIWLKSSLAMKSLAEQFGAIYLHVLQPNQYVDASKVLTPEELARAYDERHPRSRLAARGYPHLRERAGELRRDGVFFRDLTMVFAERPETIYRDVCCHYNWHGNQILGATIASLIADALDEAQATGGRGQP